MRTIALASVLAAGCTPDPQFDPIVIDISANCNESQIAVIGTDLDAGDRPWLRLLDAADDGPGTDALWLLVVVADESASERLELWHLTGNERDAAVQLNLVPDAADALELVPGPTPGEAWLVYDNPGDFYQLWRVDAAAEFPLLAQSANLVGFPSDDTNCLNSSGDPIICDSTKWPRLLAFPDGLPHIVSPRPFSNDQTTDVWVARLDTGLNLGSARALNFERSCDSSLPELELIACEESKRETTYPQIDVLGSQLDPRLRDWHLALLRSRREGPTSGVEPNPELVLVQILLDDDGIAVGILRSHQDDAGPRALVRDPPRGLAVDPFSSYMLFDTAADGTKIMRLSTLDPTPNFKDLDIEINDNVELLQLDGDIALAEIVDDTWEITKLFPDAPSQSQRTTYTASAEITGIRPAGPGVYLLDKAENGSDLLRIVCAET